MTVLVSLLIDQICSKGFYVLGNTPLHLAMDSAHASIAVLLIQAGADRGRVSIRPSLLSKSGD